MFKPWIIYMMMSVSPCERRKTAEGKLVLDATIAAKARRRGVPVLGLETIDEQFSALAGVPDDQQLQMLRGTLKYADRVDDLMETVLQLYLTRQMGMTWPFQMLLAEKAGIDSGALRGIPPEAPRRSATCICAMARCRYWPGAVPSNRRRRLAPAGQGRAVG